MVDITTTAQTVENIARDEQNRWRLGRDANGYVPGGEIEATPQDLGVPGQTISIDWVEQWTAPLRYEKHAANPVYGPDKSGAWDNWTNGVSIVPTADGATYRMYYAGREGAGIGFAEAAIDDPLNWKEHPASPVLLPRADNWEGNKLNQPRVVKVTGTHWRMYYTGWGFPGPGQPKEPGTEWAMGLAESFDGGTTCQRVQDEPIMDRGDADSPDGGGACVPMVLRVGDEWMMWYTAARVVPEGQAHIHLCLATSRDGVRWHKFEGNPVLGDTFGEHFRSVTSRCYVRRDDGVFRMWYSHSIKPMGYRIRYAESLDGIHWERAPAASVLAPSDAPAWDDQIVEYPEVQIVNNDFRLWYCGNNFGSVGYATGIAETGVNLFMRSGDTPTPDATWTQWQQVQRDESIAAQRNLQVRAVLWSKNAELSPALNSIVVNKLAQ